jgi:hypothetical protein
MGLFRIAGNSGVTRYPSLTKNGATSKLAVIWAGMPDSRPKTAFVHPLGQTEPKPVV